MRVLPTIRGILEQSNNKFIGLNKPHGRVTVEPAWNLNMTGQTYGDGIKGPYRYWFFADQSQVELEVPNIESISINRGLDQDAATCEITMANQTHDNNDQTPDSLDQVGNPGFYGFGFGSAPDFADQWGQTENSWRNILIPNALIRTYQGYGGWSESNGKLVADPLNTAVNNGNLALSGVWLVDTVSLGTSGKLQLKCRDMAKLLIEQMIYTPLIPERYYPPHWSRYGSVTKVTTSDPVPQPEPLVLGPAVLTYEDSSVARWLGPTSHEGSLAPLAFTADETQISAGSGWYYWNNTYAKDWWQATCSGEINEVYVSPAGAPPGGGYFTYISIMENGVWQGPLTISYDDTGNIATYHPEKPPLDTAIPYVKAMGINVTSSVNKDLHDGTWVKLDRVYNAEKIRITMHSTWHSPDVWGPNPYRSAVGNISAKLTNIDVVSEQPAVATTSETVQADGNIRDWVDPVKELLMWAGFLYYDGANPTNSVGPYGTIETSGTWPRDALGENLFDKKSVMDAITSIKEVLGYVFFIDEEGAVHFHGTNWWSPGNTTNSGVRLNYIHEISDELRLTDYTANYTDNAVRSEIVIGSSIADDAGGSTHYSSMDPTGVLPLGSPDLIRGMTRPAIWTNEVFVDADEQKLMAALISLHIMFNARQGNVTMVANPEIQINDQVRITERVSSESFIHYVRSLSSNMDLRTGEWTMTLGTNWLGEQDQWVFDRNNLLALYDRQGVNRISNYDNGRDAWANFQQSRTQTTQIAVDTILPANINHGVGGTWSIAVVAGRDPGNGLSPADVIDSDIVALFTQVAAIGQVQVTYEWSTSSPPTGYDVVVITQDTNATDIISWGSMALFSTPTIHTRPASFNDSGVSGGTATAANSITINALTNAAFTVPGYPGVINFGDGGAVTTSTHAAADLPSGIVSVGTSPSNSEVVIAAVPSGLTYPDTNVSTKKHVVWCADIGDVDAYDASVWQTMVNAIFWVRAA